MRKLFSLAIVSAICLGLAAEEPFQLGACFHFGSETGSSPEVLCSLAEQLGLNAARDERYWMWGEWQPGAYSWGAFFEEGVRTFQAHRLSFLYVLDYGNPHYDAGAYPVKPAACEAYIRYGEQVLKHFHGQLKWLQIWNEWEGFTSMGKFQNSVTASDYVTFAKKVSPRLRAADPSVWLVGNSISSGDGVLKTYLDEGRLPYIDALAIHPYIWFNGPYQNTVNAYAERLARIREMVRAANGGKDFPVLITEMGVPSYVDARTGHSEAQQAAQLAQYLLVTRMFDYIQGFFWYDFQDDGRDAASSEQNYGLVRPDETLKESGAVLQDLAALIKDGRFVRRIATEDNRIWILEYTLQGRTLWALFHTYETDDFQIILNHDASPRSALRVRFAGHAAVTREWGFRDWSQKHDLQFHPEQLSFTVRALPLLLEGDFTQVRVASAQRFAYPRQNPYFPRQANGSVAVVSANWHGCPQTFFPIADYRSLIPGEGAAPHFSARANLQYNEEMLFLAVEVKDDQVSSRQPIEAAWNDDSIQFAVQRPDQTVPDRWLEVVAALTPKGPQALSLRQPTDTPAELPKPWIQRTADGLVYHLMIPAKIFGIQKFAPKQKLGFSLLINDNNGPCRRGYLHWTDGIGELKDALLFGEVHLI